MQRAALGHRVARVDGEIEHHLLELSCVDENRARVVIERPHRLDVRAHDALKDFSVHLQHDDWIKHDRFERGARPMVCSCAVSIDARDAVIWMSFTISAIDPRDQAPAAGSRRSPRSA